MPIQALRSVSDQFDRILRQINPKRLVIDMAKADKAFHFRHFKGYRLDKIGRGKIKKIAQRELFSDPGHELFANLIIVYWNEAHTRLYQEMVEHVKTINEDVEAIERIETDKAHAIIDDLLERHERDDILVCVRLNGVRFDEELIISRLVKGEARPEGQEAEVAEGDPAAASEDADVAPADEGAAPADDPDAPPADA